MTEFVTQPAVVMVVTNIRYDNAMPHGNNSILDIFSVLKMLNDNKKETMPHEKVFQTPCFEQRFLFRERFNKRKIRRKNLTNVSLCMYV